MRIQVAGQAHRVPVEERPWMRQLVAFSTLRHSLVLSLVARHAWYGRMFGWRVLQLVGNLEMA